MISPHSEALSKQKLILAKVGETLKPFGFVKKGVGFWKCTPDKRRFAGFVAKPKLVRGSKRVEFSAIAMGGWEEFHDLCWPAFQEPSAFKVNEKFAQFEHDLLTPAPRGQGFLAKLWTVWPSTDVEEFWPPFEGRVVGELLPIIDRMLSGSALAESLKLKYSDGGMYVTAKNYALTEELIRRLSLVG